MTSKSIYSILQSKPHNPHYLKRYIKFVSRCKYCENEYIEEHHICPKAEDMFPEYADLNVFKWNSVKLTARQHIIAHILLWKTYSNLSQTAAVHYMINVQNSQTIWFNRREVPPQISIRYAAQARQAYNNNRKGKSVYKDLEGNIVGLLPKDHPKVLSGEYVGANTGLKMSDESRENLRRSKDANRKITLWFLTFKKKVRELSDEYALLIEQGWLPYKTPDSYEYGKDVYRQKMRGKYKGKGYFSYPDGTFYARLEYDDPIITELGLITQPRSEKQKKQASEQARKNADNKEMQARKGKTMSTRKWFHNPTTGENKRLLECPQGWKEGRSVSEESNRGRTTWNDGVRNYMLKAGEVPESHWVRGMVPRK